ncbi:MAG: prolyl oligopeptidase family serine peptidase [Armatimonadetes bacterium]|nr:prolyl oligopeptidase family serine peptidase [Armatimonadota bacterium]
MYSKRAFAVLILAAILAVYLSGGDTFAAVPDAGEVSLQLSLDGGLEVKAPAYDARVGSDGNLHSLSVGETEMLDDGVSFSLGAFFFSEGQARRLGRITLPAPAVVQATDGIHTVRYHFLPGEIRLIVSQSSEKKVPFYLVLSDAISVVANSRTGEVAAVPTEEDWPDVTFTASSGAYITLRGGDRIWGPWAKRQMWELGPVIQGQPREISINPGMGPAPKPTPAQLLSLQAKTLDNQQILQSGRSARLAVTVENRGKALQDGLLSVRLRRERGDSVSELSQHILIGENSQAQGRFDINLPEPGVYSAQVVLSAKNRPLKETAVMFAFRAGDIRPALTIPPDFGSFWEAVLAESRVPSDEPVEFVSDESLSTTQLKVWRVGFTGAGGKRLYGWLCAPTKEGPHPALLQLPGYGRPKIEPPLVLAGRGYVALAMEVVEEGAETAYIARNLEESKEYSYRAITLNALRALDILISRPEVDGRRVATSGASQGGGLALILAALRPEVAAVAADVPMLCDFPRSVREGGWPYSEIAHYLQAHPEAKGRVERTLRYFDVLNFAPRIQSPALLSLGLRDTVCRPETVFAAYNYLAGRKEIKVYADAGHEGGGSAHWIHKLQWLDSLFKPSPYLLTAGEDGEGGSLEPTSPAQ